MLHVRHALMNKSVPSLQNNNAKLPHSPLLENLVLCIYFDSAQTNPVAWFFVNIVKCEQDGIIAK